ncbi:MAG: sensor histidine kinase [Pikeienuella sp.]|uniref:sensor histidine kinase n=1 Tax=Pikeienuella sp. TaxID=2831957 RepID=UPI00391C629A
MSHRLPLGLRRSHLIFVVILGGLGLVLALMFIDMQKRGDTAGKLALIGEDTAVLHTATSIFEVNRFRESLLAALVTAEGEADAEAVRTRFDILWNNVHTANSGALGERIALFDEEGAIDGAIELLARHEAWVMAFDGSDRAGATAVLADFEAANLKLRSLLSQAYRYERNLLYGVYDNLLLQRESGRYAGIGVAIVSFLVLVGALLIARRDARISRKLIAHAREAEKAAESRARFLTMVSHELRTPMNGVLGLLDVIRSLGLEPAQAQLAGAAAASAHEMLLVIEALLILSDIRDGRLELVDQHASLDALVVDLRRRLAPLDAEEGAPGSYSVGGSRRFTGDSARLCQALAFIIHYVRKTLRAQDFICALEAKDGVLDIRIELDEGVEAPWAIETILAEAEPNRAELSADALAPLAGRAILDVMGARYAIEPAREGRSRAAVRIELPCAAVAHPAAPARPASSATAAGSFAQAV